MREVIYLSISKQLMDKAKTCFPKMGNNFTTRSQGHILLCNFFIEFLCEAFEFKTIRTWNSPQNLQLIVVYQTRTIIYTNTETLMWNCGVLAPHQTPLAARDKLTRLYRLASLVPKLFRKFEVFFFNLVCLVDNASWT